MRSQNPLARRGVLVWNASGILEVGASAPTFRVVNPGASAPEASGLKSPFQNFLYVGAEAPTSQIANLSLLSERFSKFGHGLPDRLLALLAVAALLTAPL